MTRLRDHLTPVSRMRYLVWRCLKSRSTLIAHLKSGERIALRPPPSTDLSTAHEVFAGGGYYPPRTIDLEGVIHILDLGANVGYSILWLLRLFPNARVTAFEPHPAHCAQIRWHAVANGIADRVTLIEAAAGIDTGTALLSDNENQSSIVGTEKGIEVPVLDVFANLPKPLGLIKIDIEGAEYDILGDPRFDTLRPPTVVLEWHKTIDSRSNQTWVTDRLTSLGYEVVPGSDFGAFGMIWGFARG